MKNEILLGIDFGTKRVGVAISHGFMAEGIATLGFSNKESFYSDLKKIIVEQKIEKIIVGLPMGVDGDTHQTLWTRERGEELGEETGLPVIFVDESYSSVEADKYNSDRDSESARIILEQYLAR